MQKIAKVAIRGPLAKELLRKLNKREAFTTSGALSAETEIEYTRGQLNNVESEKFVADYPQIVYLVRSYRTPIAWVLVSGEIHIVSQRFSVTTSKHQGKLYALELERGYFD